MPIEQDTYMLGDYEFYIMVSHNPQAHKTSVIAQCRKGSALGYHGIEIDGDVEAKSWSVEVNETEASVYATVKGNGYIPRAVLSPIGEYDTKYDDYGEYGGCRYIARKGTGNIYTTYYEDDGKIYVAVDNVVSNYYNIAIRWDNGSKVANIYVEVTYGSTNRYGPDGTDLWSMAPTSPNDPRGKSPQGPSFEGGEFLIARFAIDPEQADPESWDEPADTGPPDLTMEVEIHGALSGRHNDPLHDLTYSYVPADQDSVKGYGDGGDGGHGGGGGGGASTVIVREFATAEAGSTDVKAYAKRHGYGGGGGKGGKGGDGCIIIYY